MRRLVGFTKADKPGFEGVELAVYDDTSTVVLWKPEELRGKRVDAPTAELYLIREIPDERQPIEERLLCKTDDELTQFIEDVQNIRLMHTRARKETKQAVARKRAPKRSIVKLTKGLSPQERRREELLGSLSLEQLRKLADELEKTP